MRKIALQMDPLKDINPLTDTTLLLGVEAQARGWEVYYYTPAQLYYRGGEVRAQLRKVKLSLDVNAWCKEEGLEDRNLQDVDCVLLRQNPPFDMAYLTTTYLLERLMPHTLVLNNPASVRNWPEKLFPLDFPEYIPPTLISCSMEAICAFHKEHEDIVIKPLYGYGGIGIFRLQGQAPDFSTLAKLLSESPEPIIAQRFLPEVAEGERRMIIIDGEIKATMGRIPPEGEFRANLRLGGTAVKVEVTKRQRKIGEKVGEVLKEKGLLLAGVDFIGDYLTEINTTSPTGLRQLNALYNLHLEKDFWNAAERYMR